MFVARLNIRSRVSRPAPGIVLIACLAVAGCVSSGPAYGPPSKDVAATIEMTNSFEFVPSELRIKSGETVEWRNRSFFSHTVTIDPPKPGEAVNPMLPANAKPFDVTVAPGQVYRHRFTVSGAYRYYCEPHEYLSMRGSIKVEAAP